MGPGSRKTLVGKRESTKTTYKKETPKEGKLIFINFTSG